MRKDGRTEIQHYVPQLLLRLHTNDPTAKKGYEQVWCFDKSTDKVFSPNIKGILAGAGFYEIEINGEVLSLEGPLSKLENRVAPILAGLVETRTLREISGVERQTIAEFCAVQFIRTPALREQIRDLSQGVFNALQKRGFKPEQLGNAEMPSEKEIKAMSLEMLNEAPATYGPHFLSKHWYLIEATDADPFHLGDHPVVVDNDFAPPGRGIGLASPGATVYLPLCPTLCLGMTDARVIAQVFHDARKVENRYKKLKRKISRLRLSARDITVLQQMTEDRDKVSDHVTPLKRGAPTPYDHQVVMRVNSLQMIYASRWIISSKPDFTLPKNMISDNEKFRKGSTMAVE